MKVNNNTIATNHLWNPLELCENAGNGVITLPTDVTGSTIGDPMHHSEAHTHLRLTKQLLEFFDKLPEMDNALVQPKDYLIRLMATAMVATACKVDPDYVYSHIAPLKVGVMGANIDYNPSTKSVNLHCNYQVLNQGNGLVEYTYFKGIMAIEFYLDKGAPRARIMKARGINDPDYTLVFDLVKIGEGVNLGQKHYLIETVHSVGDIIGKDNHFIPVFQYGIASEIAKEGQSLNKIGINLDTLHEMVLHRLLKENLLVGAEGMTPYIRRIGFSYDMEPSGDFIEIAFSIEGMSHNGYPAETRKITRLDAKEIILLKHSLDQEPLPNTTSNSSKVTWCLGNFNNAPKIQAEETPKLTSVGDMHNQMAHAAQAMHGITAGINKLGGSVHDSLIATEEEAELIKSKFETNFSGFVKEPLVPEDDDEMKQPNTQANLKAGISLQEAVAHARTGMAKQAEHKTKKLEHNPSASALGGYFKTRVKAHFGKTVTLNPKAFGQLKQLITRVGKNKVYRTMEMCLDNWDEFLAYVKQERNWTPDCKVPNMGILLHLADEMAEFYSMKSGDKDVEDGKTAYQTEDEVSQSNKNAIDNIWGD